MNVHESEYSCTALNSDFGKWLKKGKRRFKNQLTLKKVVVQFPVCDTGFWKMVINRAPFPYVDSVISQK